MKKLLTLLAVCLPLLAFGQAVSRTELQATNRILRLMYTNVASMRADVSTNTYRYTMGLNTASDTIDGDWVYEPTSTTATNHVVLAHASGNGRIKRIIKDRIWVEWFGAIGDSVTPDDVAIQRAVDYAKVQANKPIISHRYLSYALTNPIVVYKFNVNTTAFDQVYGLTFEFPQMTPARSVTGEYLQLNTNFPCVILQYVDSVEFKNASFRGLNTIVGEGRLGTANQMLYESNWLSGVYAVRTNRYSPHAGVVTDPFSSDTVYTNAATGTNNQYPGFGSFYVGTTGGSARMRFTKCTFVDLVAGAVFNPNAAANLLQGDNVLFDHCAFGGLRDGVVTCQSQSKDVVLYNCSASYVGTLVSTKRYGRQLGAPPMIIGGEIAYCRWLCDVNNARGKFSVDGLFTESLVQIGIIGDGQEGTHSAVSIKNTKFGFIAYETLRPDFMGYFATPIHWEACTFSVGGSNVLNFVNGLNTSPLGHQRFTRCTFAAQGKTEAASSIVFTAPKNASFDSCTLYDNDLTQDVGMLTDYWRTLDLTDQNRHFMWWGARFTHGTTNYVGAYDMGDVEASLQNYFFASNGTATLNVGGGAGGDIFAARRVRVGDILVTRSSQQVYEPDGAGTTLSTTIDAYLGTVASVSSTGAITLVDVPKCWNNGVTVGSATLRRVPRFHQPTTADFTSGNEAILNVSAPTAWAVGDRIRHPLLPEWAVITNISGSTFTLNTGPTATATGTPIYDARYSRVYDSSSVGLIDGNGNNIVTNSTGSDANSGSGGSTNQFYYAPFIQPTSYDGITNDYVFDPAITKAWINTAGSNVFFSNFLSGVTQSNRLISVTLSNGSGVALSTMRIPTTWRWLGIPVTQIHTQTWYKFEIEGFGVGNVATIRHMGNTDGTSEGFKSSATGSGNGYVALADNDTGKWFSTTVTNVTQSISNIFVDPWPTAIGNCWKVSSSNYNSTTTFFEIRWTNGPCEPNVNVFAAASVITADGATGARTHEQTNRMTAAQTLVLTNQPQGIAMTVIVPGEASGGAARVLTIATVAASLIRTNDSAFIASASYGISIPAGYALEISSLKKVFLSSNVWDLKLSYQPQ